MSLIEYTMEYEAQQVRRAVPLTISEAWDQIQMALGPAPVFPSDMPSRMTVDWVRRAGKFGRYFLTVFRPWTGHRPEKQGGTDPWGELVHFVRFLSGCASSEALRASLCFLSTHPLNVLPVCCPELIVLEDRAEEHDVHAEQGHDETIESGERSAKLGTYGMMEPDDADHAELGTFAMTEDNVQDAKPSPSIPSDPIPPNTMPHLQRVVSTLGITLPSGYKAIHSQLGLLQECLKLSGAPPQCLEHLCHQAQWSRNMLVQSFVHLPWLFQRDVVARLSDPMKGFAVAAHALDQLYGVSRPGGVQQPMTVDGVLDVDLIVKEHDSLVASAAVYLHCTARTNEEIETNIFQVEASDKLEWCEPLPTHDGGPASTFKLYCSFNLYSLS